MKTYSSLLMVFVSCASLFAADKPLFEERFNQADGVVFLNEAAQGPGGSGVSGHVDDRAYTAAAESKQLEGPRPCALVTDVALPPEMPKFTVTLWFKNAGAVDDPDSLLNIGGLYLLFQKNAGWTMRVEVPRGGREFSNWFASKSPGQLISWQAEAEWIFYAIAWDYDAKTATVYQGTAKDPAVVNRTFDPIDVTGPLQNAKRAAVIGNHLDGRSGKPGARPFAGSIDNVRVFEGALSEEAIEKIREADAANKPL